MRQHISISDLEISYEKYFEGDTTLLLIHGGGGLSRNWSYLINAIEKSDLKDRFSVYTVDLPGHSYSQIDNSIRTIHDYKEVLKQFIIKLHLKDIIIAGHSFGGGIALLLGADTDLKDKISHIHLIDPYYFRFSKSYYRLIFDTIITDLINGTIRFGMFKQSMGIYLDTLNNAVRQKKDIIKTYKSMKLCMNCDNDLPQGFNVPFSIYWGEKDTVLPLEYGQNLAQKLNPQKFEIIKGNHSWHLKNPEILLDKILTTKNNKPATKYKDIGNNSIFI
jgi:pimeloyl-ACP methyl ester carboxylesterase